MSVHFDPDTAAADLLAIIENVIQRFESNDSSVSRFDSERGDLDHMIELTSYNAAEGYQLVKKVRENRRARRICKDENLVMKPLYEFIQAGGGKLLKEIRALVKETEKQARYRESRQYHPRTAIVSAGEFKQRRVKP